MRAAERSGVRRPRGRAADAALAGGAAVVMAAIAVPLWVRAGPQPWPRASLDWALLLSACGALYFRRRRPVATCMYVLVATGAYYVLGSTDGPLMAVFIVALYSVAAAGRLWSAVTLAVACMAGVSLGTWAGNDEINGITLFMLAGWLVALVALGTVRHSRQEYFREVERRALAAERGREEEARRRATEERLRIVRELHDVIGHHISMINVQAATARHRIEKDPAQAAAALGAIKDASGVVLRELRSTLGVLRQVDESAPTAPAGGLDRLPELVRYAELADLEVTTLIEGEPRPLSAEVDLAAYRVLQEAITNVTRHAAAASVAVRVRYGATDVRLEVEDDGGSAAVTGDGSGIRGMRERTRALGGELVAGPLRDGGFRVRARLPYGTGAG